MKKRPLARRINISLPPATLYMLNAITLSGERSEFINQAILYYAQAKTIRQLEQRAQPAERKDLRLIKKYFDLEGESMNEY